MAHSRTAEAVSWLSDVFPSGEVRLSGGRIELRQDPSDAKALVTITKTGAEIGYACEFNPCQLNALRAAAACLA